MISGTALLLWVIWPILSFSLITQLVFARIVTPLQDDYGKKSVTNGVVLAAAEPIAGDTIPDYSNPNVWFPLKPQKRVVTPVNSYRISIPKLKIKDALVMIAGDSLEKSLIHYGGTGLPGEYGNTVIFGHSTLPQLYNPANYKTIFSLLPTLKVASVDYPGDDIYITYDNMTYHYKVDDMVITKADDLSPLEQKFDDSYLTLITCVPPGTYWERLNVHARLIPLK